MKKYLFTSLAAISLVSIVGCNTGFEQDVADMQSTSGEADFSTYVAIGNSLTSGFRDNALYLDGQKESYPSIIATQMKRAGGGDFEQPLMPNNDGGFSNLPGFPGKLELKLVNGSLSPIPKSAGSELKHTPAGKLYNNVGVPAAKSYHLLVEGYGNPANLPSKKANPYFVRFASSPNTSIIKDVIAKKPSFFSLWIGNNDVLLYATSGGVGKDQKGNTNAQTYDMYDISDPSVVAGSIDRVLASLKAEGITKGVIANIPDIGSIPFFTTVPYNPLSPANPSFGPMIPKLNENFSALNKAFTALGVPERSISFSNTKASEIIIKDRDIKDIGPLLSFALTPFVGAQKAKLLGSLYGQARPATASDFVLLTASSQIGKVNTEAYKNFKKLGLSDDEAGQLAINGVTFPMEDQYILTPNEQKLIQNAVTAYNTAISALAKKYGIGLVDAYAKMKELNTLSGIQYNGVKYTNTFVTGGAFSLDGIHLTGRGYAAIANEFIKTINAQYKSTLPQVNPNDYSGIKFP
ncbi:G-D-S-L family lipolytic protein [Elizabethkingia argentiflava]|uniref:G-D-S-L family lipolytic protein n=1 Tax=Elizabethkingia argenteiflava TaxID=2681556 RepID=A0A845PUC5_9FLAO|nr:SGNH/GDSL hydrolase family protein [Elizabethkingia argenteiflava]NAW50621.1 G-D-S-L family lipolytic protein [Elizabethkingia argenteiflava]